MADPRRFRPEQLFKHNSKFSVDKARAMQRRLSKEVVRDDRLPEKIRLVAGVDVAYVGKISVGVATVLSYESLALIESQVAQVKTQFPYIPTLLSFREIAPTFAAIKKLKTQADVFLVDGQGIAHPYRLGFASHLGLIIDKPTIGVAKSILCGEVEDMMSEGWAPLVDRGEIVGAAVATKVGQRPVYVSVGHKISLKRAIEIVKHCTRTHRIPEPIFTAHKVANEEKGKYKKSRLKRFSF